MVSAALLGEYTYKISEYVTNTLNQYNESILSIAQLAWKYKSAGPQTIKITVCSHDLKGRRPGNLEYYLLLLSRPNI